MAFMHSYMARSLRQLSREFKTSQPCSFISAFILLVHLKAQSALPSARKKLLLREPVTTSAHILQNNSLNQTPTYKINDFFFFFLQICLLLEVNRLITQWCIICVLLQVWDRAVLNQRKKAVSVKLKSLHDDFVVESVSDPTLCNQTDSSRISYPPASVSSDPR